MIMIMLNLADHALLLYSVQPVVDNVFFRTVDRCGYTLCGLYISVACSSNIWRHTSEAACWIHRAHQLPSPEFSQSDLLMTAVSQQYSLLSSLFPQTFCTTVSRSPVERLFAHSSFIIRPRRLLIWHWNAMISDLYECLFRDSSRPTSVTMLTY